MGIEGLPDPRYTTVAEVLAALEDLSARQRDVLGDLARLVIDLRSMPDLDEYGQSDSGLPVPTRQAESELDSASDHALIVSARITAAHEILGTALIWEPSTDVDDE